MQLWGPNAYANTDADFLTKRHTYHDAYAHAVAKGHSDPHVHALTVAYRDFLAHGHRDAASSAKL